MGIRDLKLGERVECRLRNSNSDTYYPGHVQSISEQRSLDGNNSYHVVIKFDRGGTDVVGTAAWEVDRVRPLAPKFAINEQVEYDRPSGMWVPARVLSADRGVYTILIAGGHVEGVLECDLRRPIDQKKLLEAENAELKSRVKMLESKLADIRVLTDVKKGA